jgi:hypothetical protein
MLIVLKLRALLEGSTKVKEANGKVPIARDFHF